MPSNLRPRTLFILLVAPAAFWVAPAAAQEGAEEQLDYRREVFEYRRAGRPDPFQPPVRPTAERLPGGELTLRGVLYDADPLRSVAILALEGRERPIRARVGERIGGVRVLAIRPRRVDLLIEEGGAVRRESLYLRTPPSAAGETP